MQYIAFPAHVKGYAVAFKNTFQNRPVFLKTPDGNGNVPPAAVPFPYKLQSLGRSQLTFCHNAVSQVKLYVTLLIIKPLRGIAKKVLLQKHQAGGLIRSSVWHIFDFRFASAFLGQTQQGQGRAPRNFKNLAALLQTFAVQADSQLRPTPEKRSYYQHFLGGEVRKAVNINAAPLPNTAVVDVLCQPGEPVRRVDAASGQNGVIRAQYKG